MELFGVIASLLSIAAESQAQAAQTNLGYANLYETKRTNRHKEKLATSSREDAYGNMVYYDPALKQWKIKNTPMTKGILDAEQAETLASLTEDATRNRAAAERRDERSIMGDEEFEKQFNNYKYRPQKTEAEFIADATDERLRARRKGADETAAAVNKSLLRTGNSSNIEATFNAAREAEAAEFEDILAGGRRQGMQDYLNFGNANDNRDMTELEFLRGIADDTTSMPQRYSSFNADLTGDRDQALAMLLSTINGNESSRQAATGQLMQVLGNTPNFAPLASAMSRLGGSFSGKASASGGASEDPVFNHMVGDAPIPMPYEMGVRARMRAGF